MDTRDTTPYIYKTKYRHLSTMKLFLMNRNKKQDLLISIYSRSSRIRTDLLNDIKCKPNITYQHVIQTRVR